MEIKVFKYVEIKGGMKQTHRRVNIKSGDPLKIDQLVDIECEVKADKVMFHIINDTNVEEDKEFDIEAEFEDGVFFLQTNTQFPGNHQIKAVAYNGKDIASESEYFTLSVNA